MNERGVAVVTGAGSGLGRAVARALIDDGWTVVCVGRHEEALAETMSAGHGQCRGSMLVADVSDARQVMEAFEAVESSYGDCSCW